MTDNYPIGPMSMVKIDGAKIKLLREQQGLTQLYLATAVEVTTDTISRWENRRYPSIKRDNGLKLAEALNVQLEDILEEEVTDDPRLDSLPDESLPGETRNRYSAAPGNAKIRSVLLFSGTILIAVAALIWYFFLSSHSVPFTVQRIVPAHCTDGQPFPVLIKVTGPPAQATALIIKETLPDTATLRATSPKVSIGGLKNNQIKWLKKINGTALFAYVVSVSGKEKETVNFSGTASLGNNSDSPIIGKSTVVIGHYHWADTNMDNVISDDEILAVYDKYSEIKDIDLDIDLIEEIWMGSEYRWNAATSTFKIID